MLIHPSLLHTRPESDFFFFLSFSFQAPLRRIERCVIPHTRGLRCACTVNASNWKVANTCTERHTRNENAINHVVLLVRHNDVPKADTNSTSTDFCLCITACRTTDIRPHDSLAFAITRVSFTMTFIPDKNVSVQQVFTSVVFFYLPQFDAFGV